MLLQIGAAKKIRGSRRSPRASKFVGKKDGKQQ